MVVAAIVVPAVVLVIVVPAVMLVIVMPTIMPCYMFWWPFPPSSYIVLYRLVSSCIVLYRLVSSCIVVYRRAHRRARSRFHVVTV